MCAGRFPATLEDMNPWNGGPPAFDHHHVMAFLGVPMFFLFLLLLGATFLFVRRGQFGPPPWVAARHSPEAEAKRILAERFARGDIGSDDFLERASILNWTPGSDLLDRPRPKKRR
jgi:putative membrane protein